MNKIQNIEVANICTWDAPDFCDAYISYAEKEGAVPLTDEELDVLNDDRDFVYDCVMSELY